MSKNINAALNFAFSFSEEQLQLFRDAQQQMEMPIDELLEAYSTEEQQIIFSDFAQLVKNQFSHNKPTDNPRYITTAGAPACGKSFFIEEKYQLNSPDNHKFIYTDPDRVALPAISTYQIDCETAKEKAYNKWRSASNFMANALLVGACIERRDIVHGTTATKERFIKLYQYLKTLGYKIDIEVLFATNEQREASVSHRSQEVIQVTTKDFAEKAKPVFFRILDTYLPCGDRVNFHFQQGDFWIGKGQLVCFAQFLQKQHSLHIISENIRHLFQQEIEKTLSTKELEENKNRFETWGLFRSLKNSLRLAETRPTLFHNLDNNTEKHLQQKTLKEVFRDPLLLDCFIEKTIIPQLTQTFGWSRISRDKYEQERRDLIRGKTIRQFSKVMAKHCTISPTVNDYPDNFIQIVEPGLEAWDCNRIQETNYILGKGPLCHEDLAKLLPLLIKEEVRFVVGIGERFGHFSEQEVLSDLNEANFYDFHNYFDLINEQTIGDDEDQIALRTETIEPGLWEENKLVSWAKYRLFVTHQRKTTEIEMLVIPAPDRGSVAVPETLEKELLQLALKQKSGSTAYMHCTHGMGRASHLMGMLLYIEKLAPYIINEKPYFQIAQELQDVFVNITRHFRTSRASCYSGIERLKKHFKIAITLLNNPNHNELIKNFATDIPSQKCYKK